jgi:uncharacterized protein
MLSRIKVVFYLVLVGLFIFSFITGKTEYPRPTENYYVNDYADTLMEFTRQRITLEGERLFDLTYDEIDGGSQIVFATFEIDSTDEIEEYDKTEIYREWQIGKDDMGVLVLLFFIDENIDEYGTLTLVEAQIEVGYRMEQYLTPAKLGRMLDDSVFNEDYEWLIDLGVANLMYQLLDELYVNVYGYESFNYDMDLYEDQLFDYTPEYYSSTDEMSLILYIFSPYSTTSDKIFILLPYVLLTIFGGGYIVNKGAGGSSGGMGSRRRR